MIHTSAIYSKASLAEFPDAVEVDLHWKTMDGSNVGWFLVFDVFFLARTIPNFGLFVVSNCDYV